MLEHYGIALLCVVVGLALGLAYVRLLKGSFKQKWPKANPDAWKDKDEP
jgi:uncharacterized membrane-anchored protein YhcB (DUF1043 family)